MPTANPPTSNGNVLNNNIFGDFSNLIGSAENRVENTPKAAPPPTAAQIEKNSLIVFGDAFAEENENVKYAFGPNFTDTATQIRNAFNVWRRQGDPAPDPIQDWECRIGLTKLYVPPTSINVSKTFRSGAIFSGALRQPNSPKFNSGHSETTVSMTLYFPNYESIWGIPNTTVKSNQYGIIPGNVTVNFDTDHYSIIDSFCSSLRALIAQFKYAPFLPIQNAYLNTAHNISAVSMESMQVSTMEGYPFCLCVELHMLKFNFDVYLPGVSQYSEAIDWSLFRQYVGRGVVKLDKLASQTFATSSVNATSQQTANSIKPNLNPTSNSALYGNTLTDSLANYQNLGIHNDIQFYYPQSDPNPVIIPNDSSFQMSPMTQAGTVQPSESWWTQISQLVGLGSISAIQNNYESYQTLMNANPGALVPEYQLLLQYSKQNALDVTKMSESQLQSFITWAVNQLPVGTHANTVEQLKGNLTAAWCLTIMQSFTAQGTALGNAFAIQQYLEGTILTQEWTVPMVQLPIVNDTVIIRAINVQLNNIFARIQIDMLDDPVHQNIGGGDTVVEVDMIVVGEDALEKMRLMYDTINGLGRLEHTHSVLGFLGIQNIITALCGCKYVVPSTFDVSTIPDNPHIYQVRMSFLDFDVFQQQREELSTSQQQELVNEFSKRNPFLRIQQAWQAYSMYPQFPLAVYDDTGHVIGHLDPDYYVKRFKVIDDDIVNWRQKKSALNNPSNKAPSDISDYDVLWHFGTQNPNDVANHIGLHADGMDVIDNGNKLVQNVFYNEPHAGNNINGNINGLTPSSSYNQPFADGSGDGASTYDLMLTDAQYRNKSGQLVRAFPTYMLWLIDEGGQFAGIKMFDNLYGLQSVLDISLVRSQDIMADTIVLKISNLYSRLSAPYRDLLNPAIYNFADIINNEINQTRDTLSGFTNTLVPLSYITLQPGVRVHMRMGWSSNPNLLETVFNGTITQVDQGDIITVTAQSDAIEFSPIINGKSTGGSSSSIDGGGFSGLSGLWLSEPRDLMVQLLSMGGSNFKDAIAWATKGMIYSENKFGIRHFGNILYQPMTQSENDATTKKQTVLSNTAAQAQGNVSSSGFSNIMGLLLNAGVMHLTNSLWANFHAKRDYEVYKRNIYPGNGLGVAQYMGGDIGDGGLSNMFEPTGINPDGSVAPDPSTGQVATDTGDPATAVTQQAIASINAANDTSTVNAADKLTEHGTNVGIGGVRHPIETLLGLTRPQDNNVPSWAKEVSFRAETYMKSIWDIFQLCAALLPDYIIAVRPWMHRSTLFYGKPHWLYTSGVIPLTTGLKATDSNAPGPDDPNLMDMQSVILSEQAKANQQTPDQYYAQINDQGLQLQDQTQNLQNTAPSSGIVGGDPTSTTGGVPFSGGDFTSLPQTAPSGATIPVQSGGIGIEMHIPCDPQSMSDLQHDIATHQGDGREGGSLPAAYQHPFYMDRTGGPAGGYTSLNPNPSPTSAVLIGDDPNNPGHGTAFTASPDWTPECETWYMNMGWKTADAPYPSAWQNRRVLIYCQDTNKAVVCTPGDWGPASWTGKVAGCSPEAWFALGQPSAASKCFFGFVSDSTALGPVGIGATSVSQSGIPSTSAIGGTANSGPDNPNNTTVPTAQTTSVSGANNGTGAAQGQSQSNTADTGGLPFDPGKMTPETYSETWGWKDKIPVDFTNPGKDIPIDSAGEAAKQLYAGKVSDSEADAIWQEFRKSFQNNSDVKKYWKAFAEQATNTNPANSNNVTFVNGDAVVGGAGAQSVDAFTTKYFNSFIQNFKQVMWKYPYNRGWVVLTADTVHTLAKSGSQTLDTLAVDALAMNPFQADINHWAIDLGTGLINDTAGKLPGIGGAISDVTGFVGGGLNSVFGGGGTGGDTYDFSRAALAWQAALSDQSGNSFNINLDDPTNSALAQYLINNSSEGHHKSTGLFTKLLQDVNPLNDIKKLLGFIVKPVEGTLNAVLNLFRMSIMTMTNAIDMSQYASVQANSLNHLFNDSIYYNITPNDPYSLLNLADNPFTREFGEPVIEIREPFQRVHFLNSWQNIISTDIIENFDTQTVHTVVTATASNGKNPVTVYFDKGAPSHMQSEKYVETGLYWDHPTGIGKILHPSATIRSFQKLFNNSSDETSSKRVALWHLKKSLQQIYQGEINILGDPDIRPYDLLYIYDAYTKISGMVECQSVVHNFTPEFGFVTSITPNPIVTINDPGNWTYQSIIQKQLATQGLRNALRHQFKHDGFAQSIGDGSPKAVENALIARAQDHMLSNQQFMGGPTGYLKSLAGQGGIGGLITAGPLNALSFNPPTSQKGAVIGGAQTLINPISALGNVLGTMAGINGTKRQIVNTELSHTSLFGVLPIDPLAWAGWGAFKWLRDNVYDTHGCYINYLNKYGAPMDAGLSYNHGVAVGQVHSFRFLSDSLGIELPIPQSGTGSQSPTITLNQLLSHMGWQEDDVYSFAQNGYSYWENFIRTQILNTSQQNAEGSPTGEIPFVYWVPVIGVLDGVTLQIGTSADPQDVGNLLKTDQIVLSYVTTTDAIITTGGPVTSNNQPYFQELAARSKTYIQSALDAELQLQNNDISHVMHVSPQTPLYVAVRIDTNAPTTNSAIPSATVFYRAPDGLDNNAGVRPESLIGTTQGPGIAKQWPQVRWDSLDNQGNPYTLNYELIVTGNANVLTASIASTSMIIDPNKLIGSSPTG